MDRTIFEPLDAYCERLGPGLWAEPVNALTNLAFVIAAAIALGRLGRPAPPLGFALVAVLALIGAASGLFHTFANVATALLDSAAIAIFVLVYLFAVNRHVLGLSRGAAWLGLGLFFPYAALAGTAFAQVPAFSISAPYWPVALLIALYGLALRRVRPEFARGLLIGAGLLCVSLAARSADLRLCGALPVGTHFLWHVLNAMMLFWMIEIYRRAIGAERLAAAPPRG
ncbi:hypothetical protein P6F26_12715 [Roseibacterium sp. SDUM158017]|uniref:hypothetical protein n=1 Tax=Roseicyclus salinarum TaxID=3036773 RepID=UPI00241595DA|nr:hypothetical protein [Roseibacterium sp. SDUM158017]MDG4649309.1 hypothetical protein [Roseibacterium sp. SDUM158017]